MAAGEELSEVKGSRARQADARRPLSFVPRSGAARPRHLVDSPGLEPPGCSPLGMILFRDQEEGGRGDKKKAYTVSYNFV